MSISVSVTQFTKTSSTIALCSIANFINAADRVIMPIAIIQMKDHFNWDLHGQGWVLSAFAVGYMSSMVSKTFTKRSIFWIKSLNIVISIQYTTIH
jgi:hypothetical protein